MIPWGSCTREGPNYFSEKSFRGISLKYLQDIGIMA